MALSIPVNKFVEMKEKTELENMEDIQQKLEAVFSDLTDVMSQVDRIVSELIRKEEERKIWSDYTGDIDDDPEDDVEPEFDYNFDYEKDDDPEYDPDDIYKFKFNFNDLDRIYDEMKKEEAEEFDFDAYEKEEAAIREAWHGWDEE